MTADSPFFMWSIAEAWGWLIHVPIIGFVLLVIAALIVGLFVFVVFAES